jgi:hypothetical protein
MLCENHNTPMTELAPREWTVTPCRARLDPETEKRVICVECLTDDYIQCSDSAHDEEMAHRATKKKLERLQATL